MIPLRNVLKPLLLCGLWAVCAHWATAGAAVCDDEGGLNYIVVRHGGLPSTLRVVELDEPGGYAGHVTVPDSVDWGTDRLAVTEISPRAFKACAQLLSISLPKGLSTIGSEAFSGCVALTELTVPGRVNYVGTDAFAGSGIRALVLAHDSANAGVLRLSALPEGLERLVLDRNVGGLTRGDSIPCPTVKELVIGPHTARLGASVFRPLAGVEKLTVEPGDGAIDVATGAFSGLPLRQVSWQRSISGGEGLFAGITTLDSLVVSSAVTTLPENALSGCAGLRAISVSPELATVGKGALQGCTALQNLYVTDWPALVRIVYEDGDAAVRLTDVPNIYLNGQRMISNLVFPEGTTEIPDFAYQDRKDILSVTIPASVRRVGSQAFFGCDNLSRVVIEDDSEPLRMGSGACFYNAPVETIYQGRTLLPDDDGFSLFFNNHVLRSVSISPYVKRLQRGLYAGLTTIQEVHITDVDAWCGIQFDYVECNPVYYARKLYLGDELITRVVLGDDVTEIKPYAFIGCESLQEITFSRQLTRIGALAFSYCTGLGHLQFPKSLTSIDDRAFSHCEKVGALTLPGGLGSVCCSAFIDCTGIDTLIIEDASQPLTVFTASAYPSGCVFEESPISYLYMGRDVVSGGKSKAAFSTQESLRKWVIAPGVSQLVTGDFQQCEDLDSVLIMDADEPLSGSSSWRFHPNSVQWAYVGRSLAMPLMNGVESLDTVEFGARVREIGDYAFQGCTNLNHYDLPEGLVSIGSFAFSGCQQRLRLTMPQTVTSVGTGAFQNTYIQEVHTPDIAAWSRINFGDITANPTSSGIKLYVNGQLFQGDFTLPESVEAVGSYAFCRYPYITSLTLPAGLTAVGDGAFLDCWSIRRLCVSGRDSGALQVGEESFTGLGALDSVRLERDLSGFDAPFADNCSLTCVSLGGNLTRLGAGFFAGCTALKEVCADNLSLWCGIVFADSLANPMAITHRLMVDGRELTEVSVPENIGVINDYAFYGGRHIRQLVVSASVSRIGESAFAGCTALTTVRIDGSAEPLSVGTYQGDPLFTDSPISVLHMGRQLEYEVWPFDGQARLDTLALGVGAGSGPISLPSLAFSGMRLGEVTLGDGVSAMGAMAFYGSTISSLVVGKGLTEIPDNAFSEAGLHDFATGMGDEITGTHIDVRAARGRIVVSGATAGMRQAVYSLSGQLIYDGSAATVSVPAGTYVVRVGGQTFKVTVTL